MFAAYRLPEQLVTDNGPQFTAEEFAVFLKRNGIKHIKVAPYHPSSNGAVERLVQTFKKAMRASEEWTYLVSATVEFPTDMPQYPTCHHQFGFL